MMSICSCYNRFSASEGGAPPSPFSPFSYECGRPCPCPGPGPWPGPGPIPEPVFLSSYIEAVGSTQNVTTSGDVVFDTDPDALDIAGDDIGINPSGTAFTINRAGLYHIEWSLNLTPTTNTPVTVGLLENDNPASGMSNASPGGNFSSGALIRVTRDELPYVIRLHNFGVPIALESPAVFQNTAASIRILRFADGATIR